jgi:hypothetical protein
LDQDQLRICAIALYVNDNTYEAVAEALEVTRDEAVELVAAGANKQAAGAMGYMHSRGSKCAGSVTE